MKEPPLSTSKAQLNRPTQPPILLNKLEDSQHPDNRATFTRKPLFAVNGPAGGGKSSLLAFLNRQYGFGLARKYTDRPPRQAELVRRIPGDSVCVEAGVLTLLVCRPGFFSHMHGGYRYAFSRERVNKLLMRNAGVAVIAASHRVIYELRDAFDATARVITVYVDANDETILARLQRSNAPAKEIEHRMSRSAHVRLAFAREPDLYDHVIDNNGDKASCEAQLRNIADHYCNLSAALAA